MSRHHLEHAAVERDETKTLIQMNLGGLGYGG